MRQTRLMMGMPITVEINDHRSKKEDFERVYAYFNEIDQRFSTYKKTSEISRINQGLLKEHDYSDQMKTIFELSDQTRHDTEGYFDIAHQGFLDPSGIVKGWAIYNGAQLLSQSGYSNFFIDAGGDIQTSGYNKDGEKWTIGIRNPFAPEQIVKVIRIHNQGVATSGNYIRGGHIYNPKAASSQREVVSITIIGPNIYEADRFATAAFAMGVPGIEFIERKSGFEGYMIDIHGIATYTSGFENYTVAPS